MRPALLNLIALSGCSVVIAAEQEPVQSIEVSADVPIVTVALRRAGRFAMRLPALTYSLTLTTDCDEDWQPDSVSISIADSSKSFGAAQLTAGEVLLLQLQVPSDQIAPLRVEQFCIDDEREDSRGDTADENRIMIPAVLSAQVSLRCATESAQSITYVTKPLNVTLECGTTKQAAD